jgi:uncharacterized membrane protein HdeD (DUF308 family)
MAMEQMNTEMPPISRNKAEQISKNWWLLFLSGLITTIAGFLILSIEWTVASLALFIGIFFVVRGVAHALSPPSAGRSMAVNSTIGILNALIGAAILIFPTFATLSLLTLAFFVGIWFTLWGVASILNSIANRHTVSYWWLSLMAGIIAIPLGFSLVYSPIVSLAVAVLAVAAWAIVVGTTEIALSFEIKQLPQIVDELEMKRREKAAMSSAEEIEQMSRLRDKGIVTDEEFLKFKTKKIA